MKTIFVAVAILGVFALQSESFVRKCFPLRFLLNNQTIPTGLPTIRPTGLPTIPATGLPTIPPTLPPIGDLTTEATSPTTTVNLTEIARLQNLVNAANNQYVSRLNSAFLNIGRSVIQVNRINANPNVTQEVKSVVTSTTQNLTQAATGARRRKRQTGFTIPSTCAEAQSQAQALTEQLQTALANDLGSIISYLQFIVTNVQTFINDYPSVLKLVELLNTSITMLEASVTFRDTFAQAVQKLLNGTLDMISNLCVTLPGQTTTLPTTVSVDLGATTACTIGQTPFFYKGELSGMPIQAGTGLDGRPTYIGFITLNGVIYPGGLADLNSIMPGLYFTRDFGLVGMAVNNVTYLEFGNCNCYFIPSSAPLPANSFIVSFNSGFQLFGIGRIIDNTTLTHAYTIVGRVDLPSNTFRYLDFFNLQEATTATFERLVCEAGAAPTTPAPTTVVYTNHTLGVITELNTIGVHIQAKHQIELNLNNLINQTIAAGQLFAQFTTNLTQEERAAINDMISTLQSLVYTPTGLVDLSNCPQSCTSCFALITPITQVTALGLNIVRNIGNGIADLQAAFGNLQFQAAFAGAVVPEATRNLIINTSKSFLQYIRNLIIELELVYAGYERWIQQVIHVCGPIPTDYAYYY